MTIMAWIGLDDTDHLDGGCTTKNFDTLLIELEKITSLSNQDWSAYGRLPNKELEAMLLWL